VVTLAIWGEVTPGATLTKCGVWGNHVCNIWWLSVKGCECGESGNFGFSHRLDASPLQHWSHYRVRCHTTVWDGSIFWDKARYWLQIMIISCPLHSAPPLGRSPSEYWHPVWYGKTRMVEVPNGEKFLRIYITVYTQYQHVTDGQTDRQSVVKMSNIWYLRRCGLCGSVTSTDMWHDFYQCH